MSVIALAITASKANRQSTEEARATSLANDLLQQFLYDLPPADSSWWRPRSMANASNAYGLDQLQLGAQMFKRVLYVSDLPWTATSGTKLAKVVVFWDGNQKKVSLSRLLYAHD